MRIYILSSSSVFLSTPSARRATVDELFDVIISNISIHALREEGDGTDKTVNQRLHDFYPRPPRGGRHDAIFGGLG